MDEGEDSVDPKLDFKYRLSTFAPLADEFPTYRRLAERGFVYLGDGYTIRCVGCNLHSNMVQMGNDPIQKHHRLSPNCQFVYDLSPSGVGQSRHPQYSTLSSRTASFQNWPTGHPKDATDLAAAGFYYTGSADRVQCFHCSVGLRDWKDDDDPWTEHGLMSPGCGYISSPSLSQFGVSAVGDIPPTDVEMLRTKFTDSVRPERMRENMRLAADESSRPRIGEKHQYRKCSEYTPIQAQDLRAENRCLREQMLCRECGQQPRCIVFLPCGHLVTCSVCAAEMNSCPSCKKKVLATIVTRLSPASACGGAKKTLTYM